MESKYSKCKYCGKNGLRWKNEDERWRLIEANDSHHVCASYVELKKEFIQKEKPVQVNKINTREDKYGDLIIEF